MWKNLTLIVTKKWFDLIKSWEKREDFREIKKYWIKRLMNLDGSFKDFDELIIANGYWKNRPIIIAKLKWIRISWENEWTDLWKWKFFAIWIGEFVE